MLFVWQAIVVGFGSLARQELVPDRNLVLICIEKLQPHSDFTEKNLEILCLW